MINKNPDGKWIVTGVRLPLHQLWQFFDKYELIHDMLDGKIYADNWTDETSHEQKISDMLSGSTVINAEVVSDYLKFKDFEKKYINMRFVQDKIGELDKKIDNLTTVLHDILTSNMEIKKSLNGDTFVTLKEIADAFIYNGKRLYKVGSLRNMLKKEKFGSITIAHLDIFYLHIILIKKGKLYVTPRVHWYTEKNKITYDFLSKLYSKNKNVYSRYKK